MSRGDFRSGSRIGYGRVGRRARKAGRVGPDDESERAHDHEESSVPPLDPPQTRRERARAEQALTARSAPLGRTARLGAQVVVLALVVGATSAFTVLHKSVTVDVDGSTVEVSAFGRTVGDVLADGKISVGDRDLVAPGLGESISSGSQVVVRHAHEIAVEVDGRPETVSVSYTHLRAHETRHDLVCR